MQVSQNVSCRTQVNENDCILPGKSLGFNGFFFRKIALKILFLGAIFVYNYICISCYFNLKLISAEHFFFAFNLCFCYTPYIINLIGRGGLGGGAEGALLPPRFLPPPAPPQIFAPSCPPLNHFLGGGKQILGGVRPKIFRATREIVNLQ